jgi:thymidylate synthase ThyX
LTAWAFSASPAAKIHFAIVRNQTGAQPEIQRFSNAFEQFKRRSSGLETPLPTNIGLH